MNGWLIVNKFLNTGKFNDIYDRLLKAANDHGSSLTLMSNADLTIRADTGKVVYPKIESVRPDYVIFWDKDVSLARLLEADGLRLYNRADAIMACDDKSLTCERLRGIVRMPATFNVPFTYENTGYNSFDFIARISALTGYPFILKECFGSFGAQVHLIRSEEECIQILKSINGRPCIIQEYIRTRSAKTSDFSCDHAYSSDIRINVVGGKCAASMLRYNDNDFRANITAGGHMCAYDPTDDECEMALKACKALGLDFAGVDILQSDDGPLLCEVNSNAHFKSIYDCTGINIADEIIKHILKTA